MPSADIIGTDVDGESVRRAGAAVADTVRRHAHESEQLGTMAPAVVEALQEAGLFSILVPAELGGAGVRLTTAMDVFESVSRADGSTGWSLMANALATSLAAAFCGDDAVEAMFGEPGAIVAGMLGPGGRCVAVDGGYRGSGRYSFGSGAGHADWLAAGMFVVEDGQPRKLANGIPEVRVCIIPRRAVRLTGNWDVMGLIGTGSFDYEVPDQFVGTGYTFERTALDPERGGPIFSFGVAGFASVGHTAVALGITARALEEVAVLAAGKTRPAYPTVVGEHPLFVHGFAEKEAAYQAARAYGHQVFDDAERTVYGGGQLSAETRQRFRQVTTYAHSVAADVVRWCYTWAGSDALRLPSPLGRCQRDISGATQHVYVDPATMVDAGIELLDGWRGRAEA